MSEYAPPAPPSSGINLEDLKGRLLLIKVHDIKREVPTSFGPKDAARVDIVVLDGDDKGTEHTDTLLFPKIVTNQLEKSIGSTVLARLGQGTAKPGQKPPWMLNAGDDKDMETARKYSDWKKTQIPAPPVDEDPF